MGARSALRTLRAELDARDVLHPVLQIVRSNGVTLEAVRGRRLFPLALRVARREVFAYLHAEAELSYPTIGRLFGGRDHTTIVKTVLAHERPEYRAKVAARSRVSMRQVRAAGDAVLARVYPDLSAVLLQVLSADDLAALIRARHVRRRGETYVWTARARARMAKTESSSRPAAP